MRQATLVSDESALEACACSRRCAIRIDDLYLYLSYCTAVPTVTGSGVEICNFSTNSANFRQNSHRQLQIPGAKLRHLPCHNVSRRRGFTGSTIRCRNELRVSKTIRCILLLMAYSLTISHQNRKPSFLNLNFSTWCQATWSKHLPAMWDNLPSTTPVNTTSLHAQLLIMLVE